MTIVRSTAYIGRHGDKVAEGPDKDKLKPGQPHVLYGHTGIGIIKPLIAEMGLTPNQIEYGSSPKVRAIHSNRAILAGAFDLPVPLTFEQAQALNLPEQLRKTDEPELDYNDFIYNPEMLKNQGYENYARFWFSRPHEKVFLDVKVTSAEEFIKSREHYLKRIVSRLGNGTRLMIHTTHSPPIEAILKAAKDGPKSLDSIGGFFLPGGTADGHMLVHVDRYDKSDKISEVIIERPGKEISFSSPALRD
jgi:hypothetical protein